MQAAVLHHLIFFQVTESRPKQLLYGDDDLIVDVELKKNYMSMEV
jgi:hypothetical protein